MQQKVCLRGFLHFQLPGVKSVAMRAIGDGQQLVPGPDLDQAGRRVTRDICPKARP